MAKRNHPTGVLTLNEGRLFCCGETRNKCRCNDPTRNTDPEMQLPILTMNALDDEASAKLVGKKNKPGDDCRDVTALRKLAPRDPDEEDEEDEDDSELEERGSTTNRTYHDSDLILPLPKL